MTGTIGLILAWCAMIQTAVVFTIGIRHGWRTYAYPAWQRWNYGQYRVAERLDRLRG